MMLAFETLLRLFPSTLLLFTTQLRSTTALQAHEVPEDWCGTRGLAPGALGELNAITHDATHAQVRRLEHERATALAARQDNDDSDSFKFFTIPIWYHVVADSSSADPGSSEYVSETMLANQLAYLQAAYATASIQFDYLGTTRTVNDTWASNGDDTSMKRTLRQGNYETLNVYIQTQYQAGPSTPDIPAGSILLGLGSMPVNGVLNTTNSIYYDTDGVNIRAGAVTGGSIQGYNAGHIMAHEIGHWCGLYHTFEGNTCSDTSYGDYVYDTPQQERQTSGCPASQDSCPTSGVPYADPPSATVFGPQGLAGPDAVDNYMDYANDYCANTFSTGQGIRMFNSYQLYRLFN